MTTVGARWWASLSPAEQIEELSTIELSALLAERIFWWKVWKTPGGAWLALENARQSHNTPTSILDYAAHQSYCMDMLNKRVFGFVECTLHHDSKGYTFSWCPGGVPTCFMQNGLTRRFPTWPKAVVMTMLSGHFDNLQGSCLRYLWQEEHWYRPTRDGNPPTLLSTTQD